MIPNLEFRSIGEEDGDALAGFLNRQPDFYRGDFHPFQEESPEAIRALLHEGTKDRFRSVQFGETWVAFFMLRGWEEGYDRPSFGVLVDHEFSHRGLGKLCLVSALSECRLLGVEQVMLKVAPANLVAVSLYEKAGFKKESLCPKTGHDIMTIDL